LETEGYITLNATQPNISKGEKLQNQRYRNL